MNRQNFAVLHSSARMQSLILNLHSVAMRVLRRLWILYIELNIHDFLKHYFNNITKNVFVIS